MVRIRPQRPRRSMAGQNWVRPDHGMPGRHVLAHRFRRRTAGARARSVRPPGRDACRHSHIAGDHRARPVGGGRLVEAALVEYVLNAAAEQIVEYSSSGTLLCRDGNRGPQAAPQGVYPCAGEDQWVAIAIDGDDEWRSLRSLLGDPQWAQSENSAIAPDGRRSAHDDIDRELSRSTSQRSARRPPSCFWTRAYRRPS